MSPPSLSGRRWHAPPRRSLGLLWVTTAAVCLAGNAVDVISDPAGDHSTVAGGEPAMSAEGPSDTPAASATGAGNINAPVANANATPAPTAVVGPAETSASGDGSATIGPS